MVGLSGQLQQIVLTVADARKTEIIANKNNEIICLILLKGENRL
jgi:hypothetical protein